MSEIFSAGEFIAEPEAGGRLETGSSSEGWQVTQVERRKWEKWLIEHTGNMRKIKQAKYTHCAILVHLLE